MYWNELGIVYVLGYDGIEGYREYCVRDVDWNW